MRRERVVYYSDPLRDDFARTGIVSREIGPEFPFQRKSRLWNGLAALLYYCIAVPLVYVLSKVYLGLKIENRRALKAVRGSGFFLYGNHTHYFDAFLPALAAFPQRAYVVANPDAVSLPFLKNLTLMLGVVPIPTKLPAMRSFMATVSRRCGEGCCVAVFPEAHIWPYYTGIRPFPDTAFRYPVRENAPVVAMAATYRRRRGLLRWMKRPAMTVVLSEPMYPDPELSPRKAQEELRDRVYQFMVEVSTTRENVAYVRYEPKSEAEG